MKATRLTALILAGALLLTGCSNSSTKQRDLTYTDTLFDTVISVQILDAATQDLLDGCQEICEKYEHLFSRTEKDSEISKINDANGEPVEVSDDTITLLKKGIYYGDFSDGMFDITIGAVTELWDFTSDNHKVPKSSKIESALKHVDYQKIVLEDNTVTLLDAKAAIDVGGIAKGYIADRLKDYLTDHGVSHAIINLGGDVLAVGSKLDGTDFNVGIQEPFAATGTALTSVKVSNKAVVTSGNYERYFIQDGNLYHHIISTTDGYPVTNTLSSVTIITDSCLTADALSTLCFLMGYEGAQRLIGQLDNVDAVFIDQENQITYSSNFQRH